MVEKALNRRESICTSKAIAVNRAKSGPVSCALARILDDRDGSKISSCRRKRNFGSLWEVFG